MTYRIRSQWCSDFSDLSLTHGQVSDFSFENHPPNGADVIHVAPTQRSHHNAVSWGGTNPQMDLTVIENHNSPSPSQNVHGISSSSDLLESSLTMVAEDLSSPYVGSYKPPEVQDNCADSISSSPPGDARSTTSSVETATQEASRQAQRPSTKKEKDKKRKRIQRSEDVQHYTEICKLLKISPGPKKTLAYRSEHFHIHPWRGY